MDVERYLSRIDGPPAREPGLELLGALQRAHLLTVPFENLDIHLGQPIQLDVTGFSEKIIERRRGGFCYELNGLFAWLLEALGFKVELVAARGIDHDGELGPPFDHMALLVELGRTWLVDVGFGAPPPQPIPLERGEHDSGGDRYRLTRQQDAWLLAKWTEDAWDPHFTFTTEPQVLDAFAGACRYHQTSPASPFTTKPVCSLALPDGRITLSGSRFIETRAGDRVEHEVSAPEAEGLLRERFGMAEGITWPGGRAELGWTP